MRSRSSMMMLLLGLSTAACGKVQGSPDAGGDAAPPDSPGPTAECTAQRAVYLVGGLGGFAWFTLAWPPPAVITGFQPAYAYDNPANARSVGADPEHLLFARRIGLRTIWEGVGANPLPSVFLAGVNETHTNQPSGNLTNGGVGHAAAAAVLQASLEPKLAALQFSPSGPYGTATGAPAVVTVANVDGAIGVFQGMVPLEVEQQLRPAASQLARYLPQSGVQAELNLANQLAFTANAFRLGLIGSVMMPAFNDDPHGAFTNLTTLTQRANNLATMLDAFYADLAPHSEEKCGRGGNFLSLADNVVMVVVGDTPKNSFDNAGWADGTIQNSNWVYVRSNGFTRPGWFGQIAPNVRTNFNPNTGALDPAASAASNTAAAFAGALYAIARGDATRITPFTTAPFGGVVLR